MRFKSLEDIKHLGPNAKKQIEAVLQKQGGFNNQKRASSVGQFKQHNNIPQPPQPQTDISIKETTKKKTKPSRVMRTHEGLTYCPWPSTDPFVAIIQRLEAKYGRHDAGGMVLTELIIDGGAKDWRFDIALISPFEDVDVNGRRMKLGYTCLVEADGFGFHRSKEAFKNDRAKQTHALKQGFAVKRITNADARQRLDDVIDDIDNILSQPRLYEKDYEITPKGKTQSVLRWLKSI
jgi:hypothetical protein